VTWIKKGLIYKPNAQADWMVSHAQCPTGINLGSHIRIFFSVRDRYGESLPTFIDVDAKDPSKILYEHNEPILLKGRKGTFDENGIIPNYIIRRGHEIYLYYAGWSRSANVPYKNFTGLARSTDGGNTFQKVSESPVFTMDMNNPLSATGPCIAEIDGEYRCIYSTGIEWLEIAGKLEHTYLLAAATSHDGIQWQTTRDIVIQPENEFMAHCKPTYFKRNGVYHLWFSIRGSHNFRNPGKTAYRLGHATSVDFIHWSRADEAVGIDVSEDGWDSEMICYPHIVETDEHAILFYNGNGFGKSGFGYAIQKK